MMDTLKCNCISAELMEALQMLKFLIKHDHLFFTCHLQSLSVIIDTLLVQNKDMVSVHVELAIDNIFSMI